MIAATGAHPGHGGFGSSSSWHYLIEHDWLLLVLCTALALMFVRLLWRSR